MEVGDQLYASAAYSWRKVHSTCVKLFMLPTVGNYFALY